jgi:hypothetical protein
MAGLATAARIQAAERTTVALEAARFTSRPNGAVGGVRQTLKNANQNALPHNFSKREQSLYQKA